jgi:lipopolysaccharide transport system ATP-binding protein
MNGTILGMTRREIDRKFDAIVDFSGVERFLDTPVKRYSSGMKVRLAFAVAAHLEPEILIIDEVLAVGDAAFQQKCLGKMRDVSGSGRTVLFVSHNTGAVTSLCGRGILLDQGRIASDGSAKDVVADYLIRIKESPHRTSVPGDSGLPIQIDAVRCLDAEGGVAAQVAHGDPMTVEVDCTGQPGFDFNLGIRIVNMHGVIVYHLLSSDDNAKLRLQGPTTIRATIPQVGLNEGLHFITVVVADEFGKNLTRWENCGQFVVSSPHSGSLHCRGCVRVSAVWRQSCDPGNARPKA